MYFSCMAGKFNNLAHFFPTYASMLGDFRRQRVFLRRVIEPLIAKAARENDGSLDEDDFRKMLNYYGFGVPAIEAMACGTPVVATKNAGIQEIISHNYDGLLADDAALGDCLHHLFSDESLRSRLSKNGMQTAANRYNMNSTAGQYKALYQSLVSA